MRQLIATLILIPGLFLGTGVAFADDLYVNNVLGDNQNDGALPSLGSPASGPLRTIAHALRKAKFGDRIVIQKTAEPYRESLTIQGTKNSGSRLNPFQIISDGAVIDGTRPVPAQAWEYYSGNVFRFQPEWLSHQQLYLDGRPADRVKSGPRGTVPALQPKQWALADGWIYFRPEDGRVPSQYDLAYCAHQTGLTLYDVRHVDIDGLIIQGFQLDGINAHDSVSECRISNCVLRGNGRSGLSVGGASRVQAASCLVGDNNAAQVRSEGYCKLEIEDCNLLESDQYGPPIVRDGGRVAVDGKPVR